MKYYIYISDQKVDMLLPQVPLTAKSKVAAELGVDIGFFKAGIKSERSTLDDRVTRLKVVEDHLRATQSLGSIDSPAAYISAQIEANIATPKENESLVFFVANTAKSNLILGGSSKHLVSSPQKETIDVGWSFMPRLLAALEKTFRDGRYLTQSTEDSVDSISRGTGDNGGSEWIEYARIAQEFVRGPHVKIDFLAKTLINGIDQSDNRLSVLATPLYVAMSDLS